MIKESAKEKTKDSSKSNDNSKKNIPPRKKAKDVVSYKYNLKVYWSFVKNYKALIFVLIICLFLIETSNLVDKFLFKEIIDQGTAFVNQEITRESLVHVFVLIGLIFAILTLAKMFLKWINMHLVNSLESQLIYDLKQKFFNHILRLSYNFHTTHRTGSLISRLVRGGRAMEGFTDVFIFHFFPLTFQIVAVSSSLFYFSKLPAFIAVGMSLIFIAYSFIVQQFQRKITIKANEAEDLEKAQVSDYFTNIDSIKFFGKETSIEGKFANISEKTRLAVLKQWNYFRWMDAGHVLILGVGTFLILFFPLRDFLNGNMSLGTLTFIFTVYGNLLSPLFSFVYGLRHFYQGMADFESLFQYGKIMNEVKDKTGAQKAQVKKGQIEFKNVHFSYGHRKVLDGFNLKILSGKKIALVGPSGSGKTTLIKLLYRLYDLQSGEILIDGKNITSFKQESLRSELSIVPQECVLFDDTIYNNIAFSNSAAKREDVLRAIRRASLDKTIAGFPLKEKTIVGERGVKLSGGEKQRVSLARAILADKKILVLDEATSALDSKTEADIQKALKNLLQGRTSLIIAHRLSTIMHADLIVVMNKGQIVQLGRHEQLIKQEGMYQKLWNLQKGGYIK